ncbi:hypothetical protein Salmi_Mp045 (mitochondrion) [Salvia miltiorrhiza]|uniref:Uncharacterized protein n=1 Tax=Salvia miltiorrhiza TaxID=226208 RepID=V9P4X9_SALMI|nr:hypothetical protein Salmi_Mp045 [Salvia miltiorrhiza]AGU16576.1 hypothetical protein Salmi_Mp045 [Salvia miltiorrhiza]
MRKSPKLWTTKQRRSVSFLLCLGIQRNPMSKGELITLLLLKMRIPGNKKRSGSGPLPWDSWATNGPVAVAAWMLEVEEICCPYVAQSCQAAESPRVNPTLVLYFGFGQLVTRRLVTSEEEKSAVNRLVHRYRVRVDNRSR